MIKDKKQKIFTEHTHAELVDIYQVKKLFNLSLKYHFFFMYPLKKGGKLKINSVISNSRVLIKQLATFLNYKFKKDFFDFKFFFLQNILFDYFQVYLSKDFKTSQKKRIYFYVFLSKKFREKEIYKWLYHLAKFQYCDSFLLSLS